VPAAEVRILDEVLEAVAAHARAALPDECCGLLLGAHLEIVRALPARNLTPSPTSYEIDPRDHFAALRTARAEGLSVVGAYHSHPGADPVPSRRDLAEASFPEFVYLIMSIGRAGERGDVRAYWLEPRGATRLEVVPFKNRR
jgi:proteasome lid subunit RPN8/RPN11